MIRVLLFGNIYEDKWLGSFIRSIKQKSTEIEVDFFNVVTDTLPYPESAKLWANIHVVIPYFPAFCYKIPKLRGLSKILDILISIRNLSKHVRATGKQYDIVHLSFLLGLYIFVVDEIRSMGKRLVLTPWGSDILRAKQKNLKRLAKLVEKADYVSCGQNAPRFREDIIRLLKVPEYKFVSAGFGTEMIDHINAYKDLSKDVAKKHLGLEGRYVMVCAYNGNPCQQHLKIIDSIAEIKQRLPENFILLFPMTYGGNEKYVREVKGRLEENGLPYKILEDYLSNDELLYVRKCADLFIHAQTTDANSGTVAEYLLCRTKVVNGAWLLYPQREKYGVPFYKFQSFDELGAVILQAIADKTSIIPDKLLEDISKEGWSHVGQQWINFYNSCATTD